MSSLAERGRLVFLALAALVSVFEAIGLTILIVKLGWGGVETTQVIQFLVLPALLAYLGWSGDTLTKWVTVVLCLERVFRNLTVLAALFPLIERLVTDQPPVEVDSIFLIGLIPPVLAGTLWTVTAFSIIKLNSVRAFLAFQQQEAHWRQASVSDVDGWLASQRARPRYRVLTLDLLRSVSDERLMCLLYDHAMLITECDDDAVARLPDALQTIYLVNHFQNECSNGGLHQYFWNSRGKTAFLLVEAFRRIGAEQHLRLLLRAIDVFLDEEPEQDELRPQSFAEFFERYTEARDISALNDLDSELSSLEPADEKLLLFARNRLSDFVAQPRTNP
jgi:hypothetical protein